MRVVLLLDDDVADFYIAEAETRKVALDTLLADRLTRAGQLHPDHPYLIVTDNDLAVAEKELGGLPIRSCQTLLDRLRRLAKIRFGEHTLALTAGQLEELTWRASKQGKSVAYLIHAAWEKFSADFFSLVPGQK